MAEFDPDQYLAEKAQSAAPAQQGFDPDAYLAEKSGAKPPVDPKALMGFLNDPSHQPDPQGLAKQNLKDVSRSAIGALDYPGGLVRTGLASVGGLMQGRTDVVGPKDVGAALGGNAPKSSEYMKRLGVPEGPSADIPFIGNTSARDVGGFITDVATDPMVALAKGSKALNPAGEATENAGKSMYKSGFKKIDERLAEKGKPKLSDLLLEEGAPTGTTKQIAEKTKAMAGDLAKERGDLYTRASEKGVSVDLGYPLEKAEAQLEKMRQDPGLRDLADQLSEKLQLYKKEGKVPIEKLSDWKSNIYNILPESAYGQHGVVKGPAKQFQKNLASDFRQAIIDAGNKAEDGLGDSIDKVNEKWSTLIGAEKPTAMQIRRGETPNMVTSVDAILSTHPGILATKKAADAAKTTYVRTKVGKGLMNAGKSGAAQGILNRGLINSERQD